MLPNFIDEWVDRRAVGNWLGQWDFFKSFLETDGSLKPEMIINIDSAAIIAFVLPLSWVFSKYKMMTALVLGMIISVVGFILSGMTMSGLACCIGVFIFAVGEIICSPKFNEYIGMTTPKDKKAIYMGYSNIPFAVGWATGNLFSGALYEKFSSKYAFACDWLTQKGITTGNYKGLHFDGAHKWLLENGVAEADIPTKLSSKTQSVEAMTQYLSGKGVTDIPTDVDKLKVLFDSTQSSDQLQKALDMIGNMANVPNDVPLSFFDTNGAISLVQANANVADAFAATELLWNTYHPWIIWTILGAIGTASMVGMIVFYYKSGMSKAEAENLIANEVEGDAPVENIEPEDLTKDDVENITTNY